MENDLKVELLKESLNKQKMNKINIIRPKEEEIKNNIEELESNSNRFEEIKEENIKVKDNKYDMIVCPGGLPNAEILGKNKTLIEMIKKQKKEGRWYCAICASPCAVFEKNGILEGEVGTGYPGYGELKDKSKCNERVVVSNKCITSQGPCTAFEFGYALCEALFGKEKKEQIQKDMLFKA